MASRRQGIHHAGSGRGTFSLQRLETRIDRRLAGERRFGLTAPIDQAKIPRSSRLDNPVRQ